MGISERKQREKELRRQSIILAAEKVFFSKGLQVATVDEIAEVAELSKGTVYLYFKDKDELFAAVFYRGISLLHQMMTDASMQHKKAMDKIRTLGKVYLEFARQYPDHFTLIFQKELHKIESDDTRPEAASCLRTGIQTLAILKMIIMEGMEERSIRRDIDPAQLALILWGEIHGVIAIASREENCSHFEQFCTFDLESIVTTTIDVIINGIKTHNKNS